MSLWTSKRLNLKDFPVTIEDHSLPSGTNYLLKFLSEGSADFKHGPRGGWGHREDTSERSRYCIEALRVKQIWKWNVSTSTPQK